MAHWLQPIPLQNELVRLEPLALAHSDGLARAVSDGELWKLWYTSAPAPQSVRQYVEKALGEHAQDLSLPFTVFRKQDNTIVGTTRFMNADPNNKRVEIGTTWYSQSAQRTGINTACKYLLLRHAFETLQCIAVEFRTHWHNHPSRKAIQRLGAKQDGVLRNHKLDRDGNLRDTVVFSILNSEWPTVKKGLEFKMRSTDYHK